MVTNLMSRECIMTEELFQKNIAISEPNGLSVESNELSVSVENGNFILNGIMLNDTTCQSIEVKVQRAIQYVHESGELTAYFKNFIKAT